MNQEKINKLDELFCNSDSVIKVGEEIMKGYDDANNQIMLILDNDSIVKNVEDVQAIGKELDSFLKELQDNNGKEKKRGLLSLIMWGADNVKESIMGGKLKSKIDRMMGSYKGCYDALKKSVEMLKIKGESMTLFLEEMNDLQEYLKIKIESLPKETFEEQMVYSSMTSLAKNVMKMNIAMNQKVVIMQGQIINSISLLQEMGSGMSHFNSLLKDILISSSIDNIVKVGANMMQTFREVIEKYNETSVKDSLATAENISNIRIHGIASVKYLQNMGGLIDSAKGQMAALSTKQKYENENTMKALGTISGNISDLADVQSEYMLSNDIYKG